MEFDMESKFLKEIITIFCENWIDRTVRTGRIWELKIWEGFGIEETLTQGYSFAWMRGWPGFYSTFLAQQTLRKREREGERQRKEGKEWKITWRDWWEKKVKVWKAVREIIVKVSDSIATLGEESNNDWVFFFKPTTKVLVLSYICPMLTWQ